MKAFVTGGTGFIGQHLIPNLIERGYQVNALVRSGEGADKVKRLGAQPVFGDITDPNSMRAGMAGSDVVFHLAAWYEIGVRDEGKAERINVQGTRNVLSLADELGIPRIVYTSTVGVFSDTHGHLADESYHKKDPGFLTEYDRTKWIAHYQVALPMIEKGAPLIIVMPGAVYGPGDHSLVGELMRRYYLGQFPIQLAPRLVLTFAHVGDIAEGHILAAERGRLGESYILAGPAVSIEEITKLWAKILGRREPLFSVPPQFLKPFAPLMDFLGRILPLPALFSRDTLVILDVSYAARADKAHRELGWQTRPLEQGMRATLESIAREERAKQPARTRKAAGIALAAAALLALLWWINRRK